MQVLGLTVLAWGNSIGDLSTNMAMARKGLANMAMTACYAGPLFNLLVPPLSLHPASDLPQVYCCWFECWFESRATFQKEMHTIRGWFRHKEYCWQGGKDSRYWLT